MEDSVFTKIIKGELPCHKVYEDERVISILTIDPITEGHTLVIPKQQVKSLGELDDELYSYLFIKTKEISNRIQEIITPHRVGLTVDGFGVPHIHIHLIPLSEDKSIEETMGEWQSSSEPNHDKLAEVAKKLFFSN